MFKCLLEIRHALDSVLEKGRCLPLVNVPRERENCTIDVCEPSL